jgi:hypothetical protein
MPLWCPKKPTRPLPEPPPQFAEAGSGHDPANTGRLPADAAAPADRAGLGESSAQRASRSTVRSASAAITAGNCRSFPRWSCG